MPHLYRGSSEQSKMASPRKKRVTRKFKRPESMQRKFLLFNIYAYVYEASGSDVGLHNQESQNLSCSEDRGLNCLQGCPKAGSPAQPLKQPLLKPVGTLGILT
uniref:Uncharacterized protein n=1 Tax=Sphaerodactylus townsendi TaxID=933632 RepID=A0ACB8EAU5_9SAUR